MKHITDDFVKIIADRILEDPSVRVAIVKSLRERLTDDDTIEELQDEAALIDQTEQTYNKVKNDFMQAVLEHFSTD